MIDRPPMRYHGGKWRLAPWIIAHFPPHRIYVEPFGGGASVLMRKSRAYAEVYNDLDGEVCNLFRVLRDPSQASELERLLRLTPFARDEFRLSYESADDPVEQARRTLLRSMAGFGSAAASGHKTGFRANSNRSNTTPAIDWDNYPDLVKPLTERLRRVVIENKSAVDVILQHDGPDTLHYVDPPYPISTRNIGNPYCGKGYRHELTDDDHADLLESLSRLRGMVVLSGYRCPLYDDALAGWRRVDRRALADGARERIESLWINPAAAADLSQQDMFATAREV